MWRADCFVQDGSIVGSVSKGASGEWYSWGFVAEWEDTPLGHFPDKDAAKSRVERWVKEYD